MTEKPVVVQPDLFSKWVLGVAASIIVVVCAGTAGVLLRVNNSQIEMAATLGTLKEEVKEIKANINAAPAAQSMVDDAQWKMIYLLYQKVMGVEPPK